MLSSKKKSKQGSLWGRGTTLKEPKDKKIKQKTGLPGRVGMGLSASSLRTYKNCQKLFYYQYVLGLRLPKKPIQFLFGGAFHKGIEAYYDKKDPIKVFLKEFDFKELRSSGDREKDKAVFAKNTEVGIKLMEYWKDHAAEVHQTYDIALKGTSEERFKGWWNHPSSKGRRLPVSVNGIYDRTTVAHQILEFKTSSHLYKQDDVDTRDQASIYIYQYYLQYGVWPKDFYFIVFIKGRKNNPIQVLRTKRTKEQLIQLYENIELTLESLKYKTEKDFKYGEGFFHDNYCDCKLFEKSLLL